MKRYEWCRARMGWLRKLLLYKQCDCPRGECSEEQKP